MIKMYNYTGICAVFSTAPPHTAGARKPIRTLQQMARHNAQAYIVRSLDFSVNFNGTDTTV